MAQQNQEARKHNFSRERKQPTILASINFTKLSALPVPSPRIEEQQEIIVEIERRFSLAGKVEAQVNVNHLRAERFGQSVLRQVSTNPHVRNTSGATQ